MKVEYTPTIDDVFRLKRALHRHGRRHPLLYTMLAGGVTVAVGGAMMASIGSAAWWALAFAGAVFAAVAWAASMVNAPTLSQIEKEFAARAWMRDPFRVEIDAEGLRYEHGPYRSRAAWPAFTHLLETDHHLILTERRGPGALAYGLAKRELAKYGGVASWRDHLSAQIHTGGGRVRTRAA